MKKIIMAIVCLMTMVLGANAQLYRAGSRAGNRMANYAHSMKRFSIQQNAKYAASNSKSQVTTGDDMYYKPQPKEKGTTSFWDKQQMFSLGYTMGCIYGGDKSHVYYGVETIIGGALVGLTLSDSDDEYGISTGFQFGYYIPIFKFGKDDYRNGWEYALLISPLIEFNKITVIDGEYMHHDPHHNCTWWVDESYTKSGKTGFGVSIMYRFGYGNITAKITSVSAGLTIGFGM